MIEARVNGATSFKELDVAGEKCLFLAERALYFKNRKLMVLSDLHLGKAETFMQNGLWLPPEAQHADLARILKICKQNKAEQLLILGDLIHTAKGMTPQLVQRFTEWLKELNIEVTVAIGNHDQHFFKTRWPKDWNQIKVIDSIVQDDVLFQHEPAISCQVSCQRSKRVPLQYKYAWYGHLHPSVRLNDGVSSTRLPCFYLRENEGFLPAFSSLAGGETIHPIRNEIVLPTDLETNWIGILKRSK